MHPLEEAGAYRGKSKFLFITLGLGSSGASDWGTLMDSGELLLQLSDWGGKAQIVSHRPVRRGQNGSQEVRVLKGVLADETGSCQSPGDSRRKTHGPTGLASSIKV